MSIKNSGKCAIYECCFDSLSSCGCTTFKHSLANSTNNGSCIAYCIAFQAFGAASSLLRNSCRCLFWRRSFSGWLSPNSPSTNEKCYDKSNHRELQQNYLPSLSSFSRSTVSSVVKWYVRFDSAFSVLGSFADVGSTGAHSVVLCFLKQSNEQLKINVTINRTWTIVYARCQ